MRCLAIGGEPAAGKSTLMRRILSQLGVGRIYSAKGRTEVRGIEYAEAKILTFGVYGTGETFEGTDRLSMAVMPDVKRFVEQIQEDPRYAGYTLLFEGDRLFALSFLEFLGERMPLQLYVLEAAPAEKATRHVNRGDTQTATWLKGRATKVAGILAAFPEAEILASNTPDDLAQNAALILRALGVKPAKPGATGA